jgi:cytochrome c peroxidase
MHHPVSRLGTLAPRPLLWSALASLALALPTVAQSPTPGLTGDLPDTSTWPHPSSPSGNRFHRSTAPALDISRRNRIAQLGKALFWDEQVSSDNSMACGTCHAPRAGGTDERLGAVHPNGNFGTFGVVVQSNSGTVDYGFLVNPTTQFDRQVTPVNAPSMIGAYLFNQLFWDLRAGPDFVDDLGFTIPNFTVNAALEDLAVGPPANEVEMGHESLSWSSGFLQQKLNQSYPLALAAPTTIPPDLGWIMSLGTKYDVVFDKAFWWHPQFGGYVGVTRERFAMALAHYHRTLIPDQAPIDLGMMTGSQVAGFNLMKTRGSCFKCHSATTAPALGPNGTVNPWDNLFSDGQAHTINLPGQPKRKTPTLRNLGLQKKFFSTGHGSDGISNVFVTNFSQLIDFYNQQGPGLNFSPPLNAVEKAQVIDFLQNALTDPRVAAETAPFDRPKLYSESHPFGGNLFGTGTAGPSGFVPQILAHSPPKVPGTGAGDWFKIGVGNAPPLENSYLMLGSTSAPGPVVWINSIFAYLSAGLSTNEGFATVQQPVTLTPAMIGTTFYAQWKIADGSGACLSDAAKLSPF